MLSGLDSRHPCSPVNHNDLWSTFSVGWRQKKKLFYGTIRKFIPQPPSKGKKALIHNVLAYIGLFYEAEAIGSEEGFLTPTPTHRGAKLKHYAITFTSTL